MFKALSPIRFFIVIMIYFVLLLAITIWSSSYDIAIDISSKEMLFKMKILQVVTVFILFIIPACMFALFFSSEKLHFFLMHKSPGFLFILVSCLLIVTAMPFISYLEGLNKSMTLPAAFSGIEQWMKNSEIKVQQIEEAFMKDQTVSDLIMNLFVIAFMAALSEELFFRGLIQRSMVNMTKNIHLSIWVTAILFSAFHMQFYGFVPRVLLGGILGYIYVWSGSLWTSIVVHFMNNALVLIVTYSIAKGYLPKSIEAVGMNGDTITLSWALPSLFLIIVGMFLLYKMRKPVQILS